MIVYLTSTGIPRASMLQWLVAAAEEVEQNSAIGLPHRQLVAGHAL